MKGKLLLLAGAAVGYVFGTRAGRERYEEIKARATKAWNDPRVQEKVTEAEHFVNDTAKHKLPEVQERLSETARGAMDKAKAKFGDDQPGDDALTTKTASTTSTPSSTGSSTSS
jgi:hypothetical protein